MNEIQRKHNFIDDIISNEHNLLVSTCLIYILLLFISRIIANYFFMFNIFTFLSFLSWYSLYILQNCSINNMNVFANFVQITRKCCEIYVSLVSRIPYTQLSQDIEPMWV